MPGDLEKRKDQVEALRAADTDRQRIAGQLKAALDEGRLSLDEYDERVRDAYAAKTYGELLVLVADVPRAGMSATDLHAKQLAQAERDARKLPTALLVLWTIYGSIFVVNLVVWALVAATVAGDLYPWPIWLLVPGAALGATTVGVQAIRRRNRR